MTKRFVVFTGCALICCSSLLGQQNQRNQDSGRNDGQSQVQDSDRASERNQLPAALEELDLSSDQKEKIRQTVQQHNEKLKETWQKFHEAHARTIELEAAWVAAVRDTLSKQDQQSFDRQRQEDAHSSRRFDGNENQTASGGQLDNGANQNQGDRRQSARDRLNRDTAGQRDPQSANVPSRTDGDSRLLIVTVVSPLAYAQGANQNAQQKQQCSQACQQYEQKLKSAWQRTEQLHRELVQIEAERMASIEAELNESQLQQLRESRQQPADEVAEGEGRDRVQSR